MDPRPDIPLVSEEGEPCMSGCKESVEITMRARVLDVTPEADEETSAGITVD
jgi:cytochrome c